MHVCMCVCGLCQVSPSWAHCVCRKSSRPPVESSKLFRMSYLALVGCTFDSGPTLLKLPCASPPPLLQKGGIKTQRKQCAFAKASQATPMSQTLFLFDQALSKVAAGERGVRRPSYLDLFRTPRLRYISLCCMVMW